MKRLIKRMTALLLSCLLSFSCVACSYENVQATGLEVPAAYGAMQLLETFLLSLGISMFTADTIQVLTKEPGTITDEDLAWVQEAKNLETLEWLYEQERQKKMNGGSDPDPTPTPAITGTPEPVPTPEIPTFEQLTAQASSNGFLEMTAATFSVLGAAVSNWWDKIMGRVDVDTSVPAEGVNLIKSSGYPYYYYFIYNGYKWIYLYKHDSFYYVDGKYDVLFSKTRGASYVMYPNSSTFKADAGLTENYGLQQDTKYRRATNLPFFSSKDEGLEYINNLPSLPSKEEIWVHPDLQDTYQNNGELEYPQQAPQPLTIPSIQQLQDLAKKLNPEINPEYSPEIAPNYIKELIEQLQRQPSVDPDPGTDPNPNPDPNPDPDVTPDPDDPGVGDGDPVKDYKTDLRQIFPFCIPFDLVNLLDALDAEPVAPKFEIPVDIEVNNPFTKTKILDYHNVIVIDLSVYEDAVKVVRIFEILFFILGLLLITRQQMIKG